MTMTMTVAVTAGDCDRHHHRDHCGHAHSCKAAYAFYAEFPANFENTGKCALRVLCVLCVLCDLCVVDSACTRHHGGGLFVKGRSTALITLFI